MLDKKPKHSLAAGITAIIIAALFFSAAALAIVNRQAIIDHISYWTYHPTSEIASFAQQSSMNDEGKFLFYASHPELEDATAFNKSCPSYSRTMAILGCYDGQTIYIYNVANPELDGIRQETAAYEMLHAAYKRLSSADRANLDKLIEAQYAKDATSDTDASVAYFAKYEPGQRDDELFSVIATQFSSISPQLEAYYSRYFTNRQALVSLYQKYSSVFTNLQNQSTTLYNQLTALSQKINSDTAAYNASSQQLNADIATFNQQAQSGTLSQSSYNSQRASLEARISDLQAQRDSINAEIETYNSKLQQYNSLAVRYNQLNQSMNSNLAPAPSL